MHVCLCGHELADHDAGGNDCLALVDDDSPTAPPEDRGRAFTGCDCIRFQPADRTLVPA